MDIRQITYFVEVARHGNMTQAAAKLHISQPALSKCIANLEEELGKELFIRKPGQIVITNEGKELLNSAQDLLCQFNNFQNKFCAEEKVKYYKIGCSSLISSVKYSDVLTDFTKTVSGVTYIEDSSSQLIKYIIDKRIDMAICMLCGSDYTYLDRVEAEQIDQGNFCMVEYENESDKKHLVTSCELLNKINGREWHSVYYSDRKTELVGKVMYDGYIALVPDFMVRYFPEDVKVVPQNYCYTVTFITNSSKGNARGLESVKRYIKNKELKRRF